MVELLSYWKLACPAKIEVRAAHLTSAEIAFWTDLIRQGMGEFFYVNQIDPSLSFEITSTASPHHLEPSKEPVEPPHSESYLVLVGGGKDSIVTLELLRRLAPGAALTTQSFVLNPIPASLAAISQAGYPSPLQAKRSLDPQLIALNAQGYLNGHTPFSALLAFVSCLVAYQNGIRCVLASNESSASEGNVSYCGFEINHQYSKSLEFEKQFRDYLTLNSVPVQYLSFLRPINELQICALFSTLRSQHQIFRSCNREQTMRAQQRDPLVSANSPKRAGWCAECPKCVFTYLCLSCFLPQAELTAIFGVNPGSTPSFLSLAQELAGLTEHKPFECVGTYEEVRASILHLIETDALTETPSSDLAKLRAQLISIPQEPIRNILRRWNEHHFLDTTLGSLLREQVRHATEGLTS
jgi:hypothetical protein